MITTDSAAVAAPDAGSDAAPVAAPVTDAGTGQGPSTASAAREQLFGRTAPTQTVEEAKAALGAQPRGPDGQFIPTETAAADTAPAPAVAEATPVADAAATTTEPTAATAPEGFVRIDLPEGHALRARGQDHLLAPQGYEDYFRWAVQNAVRRDDIVKWQSYANQWKDRATQAEARATALAEVGETVLLDPKTAHIINDMKTTYGEEYAEAFKRGLLKDKVEGRIAELDTQRQAQEAEQGAVATATNFANAAYADAVQRFPLWTSDKFDDALASYGALMERRGEAVPDLNVFVRHAQALYLQEPAVQQQMQALTLEHNRTEAERVRQGERDRLAKEERDRLETARQRRVEIPMAGLPSAAATSQTLGVQSGPKNAREARDGLFSRRTTRV